jgi:hypothetical protein
MVARKSYPRASNGVYGHIANPDPGFPKRLYFKKVAGPDVHPIQMYDVVFDEMDMKIRGFL